MSRTVCSWCKAPLVLKDDILVCSNTDCPACDEKYLHEELIRTRKALKIARSGLMDIFGYEGVPKYVAKHVRQVLDQSKIETTPEQKE